jgi:predicted ribosome quality control (RQC) complex YloA/Tae2 family protein
MDEIDKLLQDLKEDYSESKPKQQLPKNNNSSSNSSNYYSNLTKSTKSTSGIDKMLDDVKADFQQKDLAEELQRQQEIEAEKICQEEIKLKQKEALKKQAQVWLEQLEPLSQEGLWFEQFAEGYPSKLEAAIAYINSSNS